MEKSRGFTFVEAMLLITILAVISVFLSVVIGEDRARAKKETSDGALSVECAHGVAYVRTTGSAGGITVAYNPDGSNKLCEGGK